MLDAYSRKKLGWAKVVEVKGLGVGTLFPSTENDTVYQLGSGSEYFLLENRHKSSFDIFLNDEGLAVYAINEKTTSNTDEWHPAIHSLRVLITILYYLMIMHCIGQETFYLPSQRIHQPT